MGFIVGVMFGVMVTVAGIIAGAVYACIRDRRAMAQALNGLARALYKGKGGGNGKG